MITTGLLYLIYGFIRIIITPLLYLDDVQPNSDLTASISFSSGLLSSLNNIIPTNTLLIILGILIVYEIMLGGYKIIKWVYNKIPGVN